MTSLAHSESAARHLAAAGPAAGRSHPPRINLQRARSRNIRRHWLRDVMRVSVLLAADLAVLLGLWAALRSLRLADGRVGDIVNAILPTGLLGGWHFGVVVLLGALVAGAYGPGDRRHDFRRLLSAGALASFLSLYEKTWESALGFVAFALAALLAGVALTLARELVDWMVNSWSPSLSPCRVILVADGNPPPPGTSAGPSGPERRLKVVASVRAYAGGNGNGNGDGAHEAVPSLERLGAVIDQFQADTVLVSARLEDGEMAFVVDTARVSGCRLLTTSHGQRSARGVRRAVWEDGRMLVELTAPALTGWELGAKRLMDLTVATLGLIVLSPVLLLVAAAIKLDSRGPVFFRQRRIGRAGRPFKIFKFRSMTTDAERRLAELRGQSLYGDDRLFKLPRDPRITRVGRWLRRTSLDELPQLINVLRGEMSLVGPRPPLPSEVETYDEPHYCRFDVKPGMTGPWQVAGRNLITDFETVIRLEWEYIRDWSVLLDLKILLRTIPVVVRGDGAH